MLDLFHLFLGPFNKTQLIPDWNISIWSFEVLLVEESFVLIARSMFLTLMIISGDSYNI